MIKEVRSGGKKQQHRYRDTKTCSVLTKGSIWHPGGALSWGPGQLIHWWVCLLLNIFISFLQSLFGAVTFFVLWKTGTLLFPPPDLCFTQSDIIYCKWPLQLALSWEEHLVLLQLCREPGMVTIKTTAWFTACAEDWKKFSLWLRESAFFC